MFLSGFNDRNNKRRALDNQRCSGIIAPSRSYLGTWLIGRITAVSNCLTNTVSNVFLAYDYATEIAG